MLMLLAHGWRRDALGATDESLLSVTHGTGASAVPIHSLDVSLAEHHGTGLGAASVLAEESWGAVCVSLTYADVYLFVPHGHARAGTRRRASCSDA